MKYKTALLGVCNSKNVLESKELKDNIENIFYAFQPCFLDITEKNGLNIPSKFFYKTPIIPNKDETANFTKKTMQMDLNKTTLSTIETLNPDYLIIDISSLFMKHYKILYKDKIVYSVNAYSPMCYKDLQKTLPDLAFERIYLKDFQIEEALRKLAAYLKNNWDLNKIIIFSFCNTQTYEYNGKILKYEDKSWNIEQAKNIEKYNNFLLIS